MKRVAITRNVVAMFVTLVPVDVLRSVFVTVLFVVLGLMLAR